MIEAWDGRGLEVVDAWDGRGPTPSLSNTSVLITSGASGLGLATLRALAAAGASISLVPDPLRCQYFSGATPLLALHL